MPQSVQLESPLEAAVVQQQPAVKPEGSARVVSLDVLRGTVMALMLNEATRLPQVARSFPNSAVWAF